MSCPIRLTRLSQIQTAQADTGELFGDSGAGRTRLGDSGAGRRRLEVK